jgi:hypothetical protein
MAMRLHMMIGAVLLGLVLYGTAAADTTRIDRARANYQALMHGQKLPSQLTQQDLADVVDFDRALRDKPDTRSPMQRCVDREIGRVGGSPSDLERQVIDMKCRGLGEPIR